VEIRLTKFAQKQFKKAPNLIQDKLEDWMILVEAEGLLFTRTLKGYHDEPLQGKRKGQRSIRLNRQWRAIYEELTGTVIEIQEITPHDYSIR
jgi:toxin HigB-1